MQGRFTRILLFQALALVALIGGARAVLVRWPDREELGARVSTLRLMPADWTAADVAPLRLAGAWEITSDDPRVGGVSALALDDGRFVALTDSGAVLRFPRPSAGRVQVLVSELPGGPGNAGFKYNRDSEALVADPLGRGWWVAFETRNQLWLYDRGFARALRRVDFGKARWRRNQGVEGLAPARSGLLLFPENGNGVLLWTGRRAIRLPLKRPLGQISDAARLPGGRLAVLHRQFTVLGFVNAVTFLDPLPRGGFRTARSFRLRGTALDNVEAMAAERLASGQTRLWLMTDDNLQPPLRTLLVALDVPKDVAG
jgi:hypothetical protein